MRRVARELEVDDVLWVAGQWRQVTRVDSLGGEIAVELDGHIDVTFPVWDQLRVAS